MEDVLEEVLADVEVLVEVVTMGDVMERSKWRGIRS